MAKIYHHNSKPILEFQTIYGTQIIADLEVGLKMMKEDVQLRRMFVELLDEYTPQTREEILKQKFGHRSEVIKNDKKL